MKHSTVEPADRIHSCSIRKRAEYPEGEADVGALELPIHMQSAVFVPGH